MELKPLRRLLTPEDAENLTRTREQRAWHREYRLLCSLRSRGRLTQYTLAQGGRRVDFVGRGGEDALAIFQSRYDRLLNIVAHQLRSRDLGRPGLLPTAHESDLAPIRSKWDPATLRSHRCTLPVRAPIC